MTTNNPYTGHPYPSAPDAPIVGPVVHTCAADLWRALLAAAATAPEDSRAHAMDDWRPADDGESADVCLLPIYGAPWLQASDYSADQGARSKMCVALHGPARPGNMLESFTFRNNAGRASVTVLANGPRLLAMANTVRKHWNLYGGGPLPVDLAKPRAPRKTVSWPATVLRAWRIQMQEPDHLGAMITGDTLGVAYFPASGSVRAIALAAPVQVDGLPDRMCSALRHDGRYVVACMITGRAIIVAGAGSRARAEADALAEWERIGADKAVAQISERRRDPADTAAARQTWCAAHGIDDPADSAPALAAEVVTPAMADPAPEVVAPGAPPVAGWPGCADSPPPPLAPVQTPPDSTSPESAPSLATMRAAGELANTLAMAVQNTVGPAPARLARMLASEAARIRAPISGTPDAIRQRWAIAADMLDYAAELQADLAARAGPVTVAELPSALHSKTRLARPGSCQHARRWRRFWPHTPGQSRPFTGPARTAAVSMSLRLASCAGREPQATGPP